MDNEASKALKLFLHSNDIQFQLVPPHVHQQNAAERAIQTLKNHFIAMLCSTDKQFTIHLWDRLIPQVVLTLSLLRQSCITSKLSAHAQLNGPFDYNATPLAPPGTRVMIHEKPDKRGSWAPHDKHGWYVGQAMEHYRAHRVYCSTTRHETINHTVEPLLPTLQNTGHFQCGRRNHSSIGPRPCPTTSNANHAVQTTRNG
jgi:hypothetical protein